VAKSQDLPYPITLISAYTAAMGKVAADFPDDNEIALLYAEALMDLSPWNYWQPGGHEPNPQSAPIVPTLERVLAKDPNHPGPFISTSMRSRRRTSRSVRSLMRKHWTLEKTGPYRCDTTAKHGHRCEAGGASPWRPEDDWRADRRRSYIPHYLGWTDRLRRWRPPLA
jgi:hypothetical protein